jgi:hypothetical protein
VTTPEHPFAKVGAGWTRAAALTRGDRIQTAAGGDATVLAVEIRAVQPTVVHNLTVSKTHAYFVGSRALLVHNTDCAGPSSPRQGHVRKREEDAAELKEQFRARRAQRKARLQAQRRERAQNRMIQEPFNDMPGKANCVLCSLAGLSDVDKLSTLVQQKNFDADDPNPRLTATDLWRLLDEWGLRNENTPPRAKFPENDQELEAARTKVWEDYLDENPRPRFPFQDRAKRFMETSSANTFLVSFEYLKGEEYDGHALLAVRRDDGSVVYIDLQQVPPTVHDDIDPSSTGVIVTPTSVDWRGNRQLRNVVENGVHEPLLTWEYADGDPEDPEGTPPDAQGRGDPDEGPE